MSFPAEDVRLRQFRSADLDRVMKFMVDEGWHSHRNDVDVNYRAYPEGSFVVEVNGCVAGFALGAKLNDEYGYVNTVIVDKEFRGRGLGRRLLLAVHKYLGNNLKNVGLTSVATMVTTYQRYGYNIRSWDLVFYTGNPVLDGFEASQEGVELFPSSKVSFQALNKYDQRIASIERQNFLKLSMRKENLISYTAMIGNQVVGYGSVQPNWLGFLISPLYADTVSIARAILLKLFQSVPDVQKHVFTVGVPEPNREMKKIALGIGLQESTRATRMYTNEDIQLELTSVYATRSYDASLV